jgi:hypothetical protein
MWIGRSQARHLMALNIEPLRPDDVRRPRSVTLQFDARLGGAMKMPAIQILQANVDRPLEELARLFKEKAGRPLLARPDSDQPQI